MFKSSVLKFLLLLLSLNVCANKNNNEDTIQITVSGLNEAKVEPILFLNISTGLLINETFGYHPLFNLYLKYRYKKNYLKLVYEHRFGESKNSYLIMENDTLINTNSYKSDYFGLEYERTLCRNSNNNLYSEIGIGYDWIDIMKNSEINNYKLIGGIGYNIGIGYSFVIKKIHEPNIEFLYHFGKLDNSGGTDLNNNSIIIRLSYYFNGQFSKTVANPL